MLNSARNLNPGWCNARDRVLSHCTVICPARSLGVHSLKDFERSDSTLTPTSSIWVHHTSLSFHQAGLLNGREDGQKFSILSWNGFLEVLPTSCCPWCGLSLEKEALTSCLLVPLLHERGEPVSHPGSCFLLPKDCALCTQLRGLQLFPVWGDLSVGEREVFCVADYSSDRKPKSSAHTLTTSPVRGLVFRVSLQVLTG